jgi:hypothetical protein
LCWAHLQKQEPDKLRASNSELVKLIDQFDSADYDSVTPEIAMNFFVGCFLGQIKEWKSPGGDAPMMEVPLSAKDRIAAANAFLARYPQVYGDGETDPHAAIEALKTALS